MMKKIFSAFVLLVFGILLSLYCENGQSFTIYEFEGLKANDDKILIIDNSLRRGPCDYDIFSEPNVPMTNAFSFVNMNEKTIRGMISSKFYYGKIYLVVSNNNKNVLKYLDTSQNKNNDIVMFRLGGDSNNSNTTALIDYKIGVNITDIDYSKFGIDFPNSLLLIRDGASIAHYYERYSRDTSVYVFVSSKNSELLHEVSQLQ